MTRRGGIVTACEDNVGALLVGKHNIKLGQHRPRRGAAAREQLDKQPLPPTTSSVQPYGLEFKVKTKERSKFAF